MPSTDAVESATCRGSQPPPLSGQGRRLSTAFGGPVEVVPKCMRCSTVCDVAVVASPPARPSPCRHVRRVAGAAQANLRGSSSGSRTGARCSLSTADISSSRLYGSSLGCRPSHRPYGCCRPCHPPCRARFQGGRLRLHLPPGGLAQKMHFLLPRCLEGRQFYPAPPVWWASARSWRRRRSRACNCRLTIRPGRRRRSCSNRCSSCRSRIRNPQPC